MPREIFLGAKEVLKSVPYTWWPPKEYANFSVGRFDLYPEQYISWSRDQIINYVETNQVNRPEDFVQLSSGCFHLKNFLNASGQQGFIDGIREMCFENPQKMRFQGTEKLTREYVEESETIHGDELITEKKKELAGRNSKKFGCYVMDVGHKDMTMHEVKMLGLSIEEAVNEAAKKKNGGQNFKAQYQRYIFDFYKEGGSSDEGGYTEKINLSNIGTSHGAKKNRLQLNYYAIAFGASIEIEYDVVEEKDGNFPLKVILNSGDAFVTNSNVKSLSYTVRETSDKYMQQLVMREGCLLLQAERD